MRPVSSRSLRSFEASVAIGQLAGDGLAVDLEGAGRVDLDEDEVLHQLVERLRPPLLRGLGRGVGVGLGDLQRLVEDRRRRDEEEQDELERHVDHRRQVELLDRLGRAAGQGELGRLLVLVERVVFVLAVELDLQLLLAPGQGGRARHGDRRPRRRAAAGSGRTRPAAGAGGLVVVEDLQALGVAVGLVVDVGEGEQRRVAGLGVDLLEVVGCFEGLDVGDVVLRRLVVAPAGLAEGLGAPLGRVVTAATARREGAGRDSVVSTGSSGAARRSGRSPRRSQGEPEPAGRIRSSSVRSPRATAARTEASSSPRSTSSRSLWKTSQIAKGRGSRGRNAEDKERKAE